ncbi:hypothetical protein RB653_008012 [Dictyostelium firmibasis]|uniref:IPT/TIG domain-containing protein n=1 Tax=Dictyostelium firmibasis TaxID=79012 RepID=A0AAN7TQB3_9MYCE
MKFLIILIIIISIFFNNVNCSLLGKQVISSKTNQPPLISSVLTLLITNDGDIDYLNVYVNGNFSKENTGGKKNEDMTLTFNGNEIKDYKYQHDGKNGSIDSDLILFRLYGDNIKSGNVSIIYGNGLKSNEMSFQLKSFVSQIKRPDTTGGILELIGNFYFLNDSSKTNSKVFIDSYKQQKKQECQIISIENSKIKCFIDSNLNNIGNPDGDKFQIKITNIYNFLNESSLEFSFAQISIDSTVGIDRINQCQITILGKNFDNKVNFNDLMNPSSIYIKQNDNSLRNCSKPILITNSVLICNLESSSSFQTTIGDELFINGKSLFYIDNINQDSKKNNQNDNQNEDNGRKTSGEIHKLILTVIILSSILIFIFIIVLLVLIFRKTNPNNINSRDYFKLMYCSNELDETTYN